MASISVKLLKVFLKASSYVWLFFLRSPFLLYRMVILGVLSRFCGVTPCRKYLHKYLLVRHHWRGTNNQFFNTSPNEIYFVGWIDNLLMVSNTPWIQIQIH